MEQKNNIIDAEKLKNVNERTRQVDNIMGEIVRKLNMDLRAAQREGSYHIMIDLPEQFDIIHLSNDEARIEIYGTLISSLEEKGYTVIFRSRPPALRVSWRNPGEEKRKLENYDRIRRCKGTF